MRCKHYTCQTSGHGVRFQYGVEVAGNQPLERSGLVHRAHRALPKDVIRKFTTKTITTPQHILTYQAELKYRNIVEAIAQHHQL